MVRTIRQQRRGNAVFWGASLTTILGMAALVIDLGYARSVDAEIDGVADSAAYAGAGHIDGTAEGMEDAIESAIAIAGMNTVGGTAFVLPPSSVELGVWEVDDKTFTVSSDAELVNAIRVTTTKTDVTTFFSRAVFGKTALTVQGRSVATQGGKVGAGAVECYLPLALPDCVFDKTDEVVQAKTLTLQPAGVDNVGWARVGASPNASYIRDQVTDTCISGEAMVGDEVYLQNGVVTSGLTALDTAIENSMTSWDTSIWGTLPAQQANSSVAAQKYGRTVEGPIILFDDDSYCAGSGGKWTGHKTTTGFAWAAVYDLIPTGAAAQRNIQMKIDLSREHLEGTEAGGSDHGVVFETQTHGVQ